MPSPEQGIKFLDAYIKELQKLYVLVPESGPSNCSRPSDYELPITDEKAERAARLADEYGLNGNVFRNLIPQSFNGFEDWLALQQRKLFKQIRIIPQIKAKIEKPVERSQKVSLTDNEETVLYDMAEHGHQCRNRATISATTNIQEGTLKRVLKSLEGKGLIYRPNGPRSGYTITEEGMRIYKTISAD